MDKNNIYIKDKIIIVIVKERARDIKCKRKQRYTRGSQALSAKVPCEIIGNLPVRFLYLLCSKNKD